MMTSVKTPCRRHVRHVLLMLVCMVINFTVVGLLRGTGVLFVAMLDKFDTTKSATSWIMSIFIGLMFGGGILAGFICAKLGTTVTVAMGTFILSAGLFSSAFVEKLYVMYITYGVVGGIGGALTLLATEVIILRNFKKRRALASAISTIGKAAGVMVQPIIHTAMVINYGLKEALFVVAGMVFIACLLSFTLKFTSKSERDIKRTDGIEMPPVDELSVESGQNDNIELQNSTSSKMAKASENKISSEGGRYDNEGITNDIPSVTEGTGQAKSTKCWTVFYFISKDYLFFIAAIMFSGMALFIPFNFIPAMMTKSGFTPDQVALVLSVAGPADIVGKLVVGFAADYRRVNRHWYNVLSLVIMGSMTISVIFFKYLFQFVCYGVLYGLSSGVWVFIQAVLITDIVGTQHMELGIGVAYMVVGLGGSVGMPIAGWVVDVTGTYQASLFGTGCSFLIAGIIVAIIPLSQCCVIRSQLQDPHVDAEIDNSKDTANDNKSTDGMDSEKTLEEISVAR